MTGLQVADVRAARPDALSAVARRVEDHRLAAVEILEVVLRGRSVALGGPGAGRLGASRWSGPAATAAGDRFSILAAEITRLASDLGVCCQALNHAALRLRAAVDLLDRAESRAGERGVRVTETGGLLGPARVPSGDPVVDAHEARADALMREEVTAYLRQAERVATQTDLELARHLVASAAGTGSGASDTRGVLPSLPPPGPAGGGQAGPGPTGDVFANAAWWRSLTSEERGRVIREHPEWVGPRDGLPAADRDSANRALLDAAERAATDRLAALEGGGAALPDELGAGGAVVLGVGIAERAAALGSRPAAARRPARRACSPRATGRRSPAAAPSRRHGATPAGGGLDR